MPSEDTDRHYEFARGASARSSQHRSQLTSRTLTYAPRDEDVEGRRDESQAWCLWRERARRRSTPRSTPKSIVESSSLVGALVSAVATALSARWLAKQSAKPPVRRSAHERRLVRDQASAKSASSVDHRVVEALESTSRERAPRDRNARSGRFESRSAHRSNGIEP